MRITWPNGLIQNETKVPVNRVTTIKEAPRLSGSCPMIFTWNGERFQFITDVLGVAPLGASSGDGQYFPVDHDEYVSIPGEALKARGGEYEIRVTEELREVSYLDQIRLLALDHPADVQVVTNEKFKSPPFPEFRLFGVQQRVYPAAARDQRGADVRAALAQRDRVYPDSFRRDQTGIAEMHHLDLDFGNAARGNQAALILNGWVDWADGSTFLSATQAHRDLTFPYLQVKDAAGNWRTVVEDMGIPAGKPKTIAVDLTGKFLSASREVRIVTNLCVYWDEIFLIENSAPPPSRLTGVEMIAADLHFRGFSKVTIHPERKQPEAFDYARVTPTSMWNPTGGSYTRYGAVEKLLTEIDDRMVILGSGDEVQLRFRAAGLPELPLGWTRDFLLLVDGWAKDADANTAFSQSVLPLPFHSMSRYPYPSTEHFPIDADHTQYQREYNTRPALRLLRPLGASASNFVDAMTKRIAAIAFLALIINSAYIAAFAHPSIFYMANVLLHLGLGLALMIVAAFHARRHPVECIAFLLSGLPAIFLAVRGNTMDHRWALWSHILLAVVAVIVIGLRLFHHRAPRPWRTAFVTAVAILVLLPAASALYRRARPDPNHRIQNPTRGPRLHGRGGRRRALALCAIVGANQYRSHHPIQLLHGL